MEHINEISKERIQLFMMIGIWVACILLLIAIVVLVKNVNEIKSDPISYGIDKKDLQICSCYDNSGTMYSYNSTGPIPTVNYGKNLNLKSLDN